MSEVSLSLSLSLFASSLATHLIRRWKYSGGQQGHKTSYWTANFSSRSKIFLADHKAFHSIANRLNPINSSSLSSHSAFNIPPVLKALDCVLQNVRLTHKQTKTTWNFSVSVRSRQRLHECNKQGAWLLPLQAQMNRAICVFVVCLELIQLHTQGVVT